MDRQDTEEDCEYCETDLIEPIPERWFASEKGERQDASEESD